MSLLDVAVVLLAVLGLVNLALVLTVIHRLRTGTTSEPAHFGPPQLPVGSKAPEFSAVTTVGQPRSLADLLGSRSLVGFFSPGCHPCHAQLPEFARVAKTIPGGASQVLAVVVGEAGDAAEFAVGLDGAAAVVVESRHGPLADAFSAKAFPSMYLIGSDGRIEASGVSMQMLADAVPA